MPPSLGNRDDSSITANPCGIKKKTAAISHISNDPGPNFAVVPRCLRPRTATRLNRTRSRNLSARMSRGVVCVVSAVIDVEEMNEMGYSESSARRSIKWTGRRVCAFCRSIANCIREAFQINPLEIFGAQFCRSEIEFYFLDRTPEIFREHFGVLEFGDDWETIVGADIHACV